MAKADKRARKRANQAQAAAARAAAAKRKSRNRTIRFSAIGLVVIIGVVAIIAATGGSSSKKKTPKVATKNTATTVAPTTTSPTPTTIAALKTGCVATVPKKAGNGKQYKTAPAMTIDPTKTYTATFSTTCGSFSATLDAKDSPKGVNNFVFLARQGFFNGLTWHRVVQNFVIQGGDPTGTGNGGPGYTVVTETPKSGYKTGDLAWAKTSSDPAGTAGSQFFVTTGDPSGLNQKTGATYDYGYFGHVTTGLANAQKLMSYFPTGGDGAPTRPLYMFSVTISES
ncbi:MAG TPA: peptidylprolyl isomerase [Acidimicrobiia bacterium]|jgi:cyclophilin family peptidyl-prolyl cis-trans isomerase